MPPLQIGTALLAGEPRLVVNTPDGAIALSEVLGKQAAPTTMIALIESWSEIADAVRAAVRSGLTSGEMPRPAVERWLAPVTPRSLICVGTNYHDHVAEMPPTAHGPAQVDEPFPFAFLKPPTSLVGHDEQVAVPSHGKRLDWEAELAVVIGDPAAIATDPLSAIFGYGILTDLSIRDFIPFPHRLGLEAVAGKGFPGAAPFGPWITVADEIEDVQALPIKLQVNDGVKQDSSTAQMIFTVAELVRHFGRIVALQPGDVIATGTPAGVGLGHKPPEFLQPGDVVQVDIEPLGMLRTHIVAGDPYRPLTVERTHPVGARS